MALLGAIGLIGLMTRNSIVLLDEILANKASGMTPCDSKITAGMNRWNDAL